MLLFKYITYPLSIVGVLQRVLKRHTGFAQLLQCDKDEHLHEVNIKLTKRIEAHRTQ